MPVEVYIRKGCLTCKRVLDYLNSKKVDFKSIDFFERRLTKDEIRSLLARAGVSPKDALRKRDKMFKKLKLDERKPSDDELISLMEKYLGLILRPIVVSGDRVVIATKPQMVDELIKR